ncbi:MAG: methyltransferase [Alteromonadaceae bacterium]|nr:methyltransferase [Alteromonadaceae bacterium]
MSKKRYLKVIDSFKYKIRHLLKKSKLIVGFYNLYKMIFKHSIYEDGIITTNYSDFKSSEKFLNAYDQALKFQPETSIRWRAHVANWFSQQALRLEGDFVECGVNNGFLAHCIVTYNSFEKFPQKSFYLIDTYEGLVDSLVSEKDTAAYWNEYTSNYETVVDAFSPYKNVNVVKGVVPYCLEALPIQKVAYLSIDMNCEKPEIDAMAFFWDKLVSGGIIVLDDYGFIGHEAQKEGADNFAASHGVEVLTLPTGQGIIMKP